MDTTPTSDTSPRASVRPPVQSPPHPVDDDPLAGWDLTGASTTGDVDDPTSTWVLMCTAAAVGGALGVVLGAGVVQRARRGVGWAVIGAGCVAVAHGVWRRPPEDDTWARALPR